MVLLRVQSQVTHLCPAALLFRDSSLGSFVHSFTSFLFILTHLSCHSVKDHVINHKSSQVVTVQSRPHCELQLFRHSMYDTWSKNRKLIMTYDKNRHLSLLFIFFMGRNLIELKTGGPAVLHRVITMFSTTQNVWSRMVTGEEGKEE
jgi:hypothetical protein